MKILSNILDERMLHELIKNSEGKRKTRAKEIQVRYTGMAHRVKNDRIKTLKFIATDPNGSGTEHNIMVRIPDYRQISRSKKYDTKEKIETAIQAGDIHVYCSCQDFLFHGYQYMADVDDYGIRPEDRPPEIKNPNLEGALCKHLIAVFDHIEDFYDTIKEDIEEYAGRSKKKQNS